MVVAVVSGISGTVIMALVITVCRIMVLSVVMVVRSIRTGCRVMRLPVVMIVGSIGTGGRIVRLSAVCSVVMRWVGTGGRVMCLTVAGIASIVGSPVVVGGVGAGGRVVGSVTAMSGSVVVGTVLFGSRMLGVGTYAVCSVGKDVAVLMVACGALVQHSVLICIAVGIAERSCTGFQTLIALGKVIIFILRTGYKCNG